MNTTLPAKIIAYDGSTAVVMPAMPMQLANGEVLAPPQIVSVPVYWFVGAHGEAQITVPLRPGDDVVLHFSQRSLDNWLSGSDQAPDDPRQYDLTDAFCTPVMRPTVTKADTENVNIQYGGGSLKLSPSGDLTINVPNMRVVAGQTVFDGPVDINGKLDVTGDIDSIGRVTNNGKDVGSTHKHGSDGLPV